MWLFWLTWLFLFFKFKNTWLKQNDPTNHGLREYTYVSLYLGYSRGGLLFSLFVLKQITSPPRVLLMYDHSSYTLMYMIYTSYITNIIINTWICKMRCIEIKSDSFIKAEEAEENMFDSDHFYIGCLVTLQYSNCWRSSLLLAWTSIFHAISFTGNLEQFQFRRNEMHSNRTSKSVMKYNEIADSLVNSLVNRLHFSNMIFFFNMFVCSPFIPIPGDRIDVDSLSYCET